MALLISVRTQTFEDFEKSWRVFKTIEISMQGNSSVTKSAGDCCPLHPRGAAEQRSENLIDIIIHHQSSSWKMKKTNERIKSTQILFKSSISNRGVTVHSDLHLQLSLSLSHSAFASSTEVNWESSLQSQRFWQQLPLHYLFFSSPLLKQGSQLQSQDNFNVSELESFVIMWHMGHTTIIMQ